VQATTVTEVCNATHAGELGIDPITMDYGCNMIGETVGFASYYMTESGMTVEDACHTATENVLGGTFSVNDITYALDNSYNPENFPVLNELCLEVMPAGGVIVETP